MTVQDVYNCIDKIAPFDTQLDDDNAGLLIGDAKAAVSDLLVTLDITRDVLRQAQELGCQLIVSHHPVIFSPLRKLKADTVAYRMAACGIAALCAHTNLDAASGGVSDCLAKALELQDIQPLFDPETPGKPAIARIGNLQTPLTAQEFAKSTAQKLGSVRYTPGGIIRRVAVCSGSGGDLLGPAIQQAADAFVTGELRHHQLLEAAHAGVMAIEAGHFETEQLVKPPLAALLAREFPQIRVHLSQENAPTNII